MNMQQIPMNIQLTLVALYKFKVKCAPLNGEYKEVNTRPGKFNNCQALGKHTAANTRMLIS